MRRTKFVEAHTTALACIALSLDGKLLATASERGTLVRIFSTADGSKVQVSTDISRHRTNQSCLTPLSEPCLETSKGGLCKPAWHNIHQLSLFVNHPCGDGK